MAFYYLTYIIKSNLLLLTVSRLLFLISCIMKQSELFSGHRMNCCPFQEHLNDILALKGSECCSSNTIHQDFKEANKLL